MVKQFMNIINRLSSDYCRWIGEWSSASFTFVVQLALILGLATTLCAITFARGSRSVFIQSLACLIGTIAGVNFPADLLFEIHSAVRAWIITFAFAAIIFTPGILPSFLVRTIGTQKRCRIVGYTLVAILLVAQLFSKGPNS